MAPGVSVTSTGGAEVTFIDGQGTHHGFVGADLGSAEITGVSFINGTTVGDGGGTEIWGGGLLAYRSNLTLTSNRFVGNDAAGLGGGALRCVNGGVDLGSCNLYFANSSPRNPHFSNCLSVLGLNNNVESAPLFCDRPNDNFTIHVGSVADPAHASGCGLRGAFPIACGPVSVDDASWGSVKAAYR